MCSLQEQNWQGSSGENKIECNLSARPAKAHTPLPGAFFFPSAVWWETQISTVTVGVQQPKAESQNPTDTLILKGEEGGKRIPATTEIPTTTTTKQHLGQETAVYHSQIWTIVP